VDHHDGEYRYFDSHYTITHSTVEGSYFTPPIRAVWDAEIDIDIAYDNTVILRETVDPQKLYVFAIPITPQIIEKVSRNLNNNTDIIPVLLPIITLYLQ
jgi:hypothetical protein